LWEIAGEGGETTATDRWGERNKNGIEKFRNVKLSILSFYLGNMHAHEQHTQAHALMSSVVKTTYCLFEHLEKMLALRLYWMWKLAHDHVPPGHRLSFVSLVKWPASPITNVLLRLRCVIVLNNCDLNVFKAK